MSTQVARTIAAVREAHDSTRTWGGVVGLVPTMGYLHAGHASLVAAARAECDHVTASVFVNPLQFGQADDLATYPRDLERDLGVAEEAGADLVFAPAVEEMYPAGRPFTTVSVAELTAGWEGAVRPGHFDGVATVVAKLFAIAGPSRAYFGEKDYQQLQVVRRMAVDLDLPVDVVACPTVREGDGLALSSRNVHLGPEERRAATVLRRALDAGIAAAAAGERDPAAVDAAMARLVTGEPLAQLDYAAIVRPDTLESPDRIEPGEYRLLIAARVGKPRLIDNAGVLVG
ncbi:MAG: pantoate--beta-alanine ligase [Acidimicrobiia bacterium]|nr:pantoate--beta-alanine ligase [Acidimicrobiia bacterium]